MLDTDTLSTSADRPPEHLEHPKYRPDIDGLRALAVLSVVFYHAFPMAVTGGFVGVDVFFVISGFLISTIIFGSLFRYATFDFAEFYGRRIRRIFPALAIVLLASFAFAYYYLLSGEFEQFGKHVAGGAGFVSNFVLWSESGYFDTSAETKPLLHLWSLGVEEQFYIVWPILLWLAWKLRLNLLTACVLYAVASFILNIQSSRSDPVADFYSPQTRFWELMAGTILALVQLRYYRARSRFRLVVNGFLATLIYDRNRKEGSSVLDDTESLVGAALIIFAVFYLHTDSKFPGWWALLPTTGAVLFISAGPAAYLNRAIFSSRLAVWFGLISFPLYLWHWPLLSFLRITTGQTPSAGGRWSAVAGSVALAWATFRFVEKNIRRARNTRLVSACLVAAIAIIGLLGYLVFTERGFPSRAATIASERLLKLQMLATNNSAAKQYGPRSCFQLPGNKSPDWFVDNGCLTVRDPSRPTVFLLGDSHSASLSIGLRATADQYRFNLLQISSGWCAPFGNDTSDPACVAMNQFAVEQIRKARPDVLMLDAHWFHESEPVFFEGSNFVGHLEARFSEFAQLGARKIIVVGQIPTWTSALPDILARRYVLGGRSIPERTLADLDPSSLAMDAQMKLMKLPPGASYVSLVDKLCDEKGCLTVTGPDIETDLLVWDYGHLTLTGSQWVADRVVKPPLLEALGIKER
jgi:peptidoglycan/LPS O-acetylase OafA/YrhL